MCCFRPANDYHCMKRADTRKAARSVSLSTHLAGRSRNITTNNCVDVLANDCEQEISMFWDKYVQPCAQNSCKRSKSHLSTNTACDSASCSLESESPNVALVSTSIWQQTGRKVFPMMQKSGHDKSNNRDNLATVITIGTEVDRTLKVFSNQKCKSDRSKSNPISRSHTLPLLPHYSCKTRVTVNGYSLYIDGDV